MAGRVTPLSTSTSMLECMELLIERTRLTLIFHPFAFESNTSSSLTTVILAIINDFPLITSMGKKGRDHLIVKHCKESKKLEWKEGSLQTLQCVVRLSVGCVNKESNDGVTTRKPGEQVGCSRNVKTAAPYRGIELFRVIIPVSNGNCDGIQSNKYRKKGGT